MKVQIRQTKNTREPFRGYLWRGTNIVASSYGSLHQVQADMEKYLREERESQRIEHELNKGRFLWWRRKS